MKREGCGRQTFPGTPVPIPIFLTTVGVSVSRLLRSVVRVRLCGKEEKAQQMCIRGRQGSLGSQTGKSSLYFWRTKGLKLWR